MSQLEKAKDRIRSCPKDYTYDEARTLLTKLGFQESNKGKTSGSRVCFFRPSDNRVIMLHKPHPQSTMQSYAVRELKSILESAGDLS